MPPIRRSRDADDDILAIWDYIDLVNPSAARRWVDAIFQRWTILSDHPYAGEAREELGPGARVLVYRHYVIVYEVRPEEVVILRVFDGRRDLQRALRDSLKGE
jgi:toxin ParE1/3/4